MRCNLRCQTCTLWHSTEKRIDDKSLLPLSLAEVHELQQQLKAVGIQRLTYHGAEPFLYPELINLAVEARKLGLITTVVSNGTLLDDATIEQILATDTFSIIVLSLDGPSTVHDNIRGVPGTFSLLARNLQMLQEKKKRAKLRYPKLYFYSTLSSLNVSAIEEIFALAQRFDAQALRLKSISCLNQSLLAATNAFFPSVVVRTHSYAIGKKLQIPSAEQSLLQEKLQHIQQEAKRVGFRLTIEQKLLDGRGVKYCAFLGRELVVSQFGEVLPCPMLPELSLGNVHNAAIAKIIQQAETLPLLSLLEQLSAAGRLPICAECCVEKMSLLSNSIEVGKKELWKGEKTVDTVQLGDK